YAFGVIWSFTFNSLAMLVLRWKYQGERGWKVPPNITLSGIEIPVGLMSAHLVLLTTAVVNLCTKSVATVAVLFFAAAFVVIFTRAVSIAESFGKHISLLVVPARDVFSAIVQTALTLESAEVVAGLSTKMTAQEQALRMGQAWEAMPHPKREFVFQVVKPDLEVESFRIGPHTPN